VENVKDIYQRIIDKKIANVQTILNYCEFLEKNNFYENTFRVYEQTINYLSWPYVYDVWIAYLTKFVNRYKGEKIERARDLFEQVLSSGFKEVIKIL
jgi:pre-mRNA-splicing factor SYF1